MRPPSDLDLLIEAALAAPEPPATSFAELGLPVPVVDALAKRGITAPFAIQTRTLPDALAGRHVLGRAQTGSGKTLAFGLPMLARLAGGRRVPTAPRGLVLVPTRELAQQVSTALAPLARAVDLKVTSVVGGAPIGRQIDHLRTGVDILIATPGRLIDLMERGAARLDQVRVSVLDEADYMCDLGFLPPVMKILDATPGTAQRLLFSATLDGGVERLVRGYLTDPAVHAIAPQHTAVEAMEHRVFSLSPEHKVQVATEVARREGRTLIFVRTKHGADRLAKQLRKEGVEAAPIHGNLTQGARQRALAGFAAGSPRVLVATDVAARGIHVDGVDLVVHYDLPNDHKDYLHRSGRTARAGASGTVLALAQTGQSRDVALLHERANVRAESVQVHPGHPAVRELAESGEPIVVTAPVRLPEAADARPSRGRTASGRRRSGPRSIAVPRGREQARHGAGRRSA